MPESSVCALTFLCYSRVVVARTGHCYENKSYQPLRIIGLHLEKSTQETTCQVPVIEAQEIRLLVLGPKSKCWCWNDTDPTTEASCLHTRTHKYNLTPHTPEYLRIKQVHITQLKLQTLQLEGRHPCQSILISSLPTNSYLLFKEKCHFYFSNPGKRFSHVNSSQPSLSKNEEQLILALSNIWLSLVLLSK